MNAIKQIKSYFNKNQTVIDSDKQVKVLFVCMGNICRSPTGQGVFQSLVDEQGLSDKIFVDSAGTHSYHKGHAPDLRSQAVAKARGIDLSRQRGRRFEAADFADFDYVIAMDQSNLRFLSDLNWEGARARLALMLEFSDRYQEVEVPDPYYGDDGFELVFDMISDGSMGLLKEIRRQHSL